MLIRLKEFVYQIGLTVRTANYRQLEGFESTLPISKQANILKEVTKRNVLESSLVSTYPFIFSSINDENGILLGKTLHNNSLVLIDKFNRKKYKNGNMSVFGTSGSGKSFFCKLNIMREYLNGTFQYIIDPEREYLSICKYLDGSIIKIGPSSEEYLNVFDIREEDSDKKYLASKLLKLKSFFYLIFENIVDEDYSLIEEKIINIYEKCGITFDDNSLYEKEDKDTIQIKPVFKNTNCMPVLEDLYKEMEDDKRLEKYMNRLKIFVYGSLSFFNKHTNIDMDNRLVVADIYDLGEENYKYGMFLFIEAFWNKIKANKEIKKLIYIDEIWRIIGASSNKETAIFIYKIFKTIRKNNGGAIAITQDIEDLFSLDDGKYGKSIINNSSIKCIFSLEEENINILSSNINITEREKIEINNLNKGECLLLAEYNHLLIEIISNKLEKKIIEEIN
jgi:hypothetical protein